MQMQLHADLLKRITFLTGSAELLEKLPDTPARVPFSDPIMDFLNDVSRVLMRDSRGKQYSDVVTLGFWMRKGSLMRLKERFARNEGYALGKGVVFHIAPSNVPVNFAYTLVSGLLCGNSNVVRVPSQAFPQVEIITEALQQVLAQHEDMKPYIFCVRYDRDREINDLFSRACDMRVVWGGDQTIAELRKSPLGPRAGEITFADRYSLAVIDSDGYLAIEDKKRVAEDFYNDTFFSDQNACTSPRVIVWTGHRIEEAKACFWEAEHDVVEKKYVFQPIQAVNKLTQAYLVAVGHDVKIEDHKDNLIVRVKVEHLTEDLMQYRENSGYFYEYDCTDILDLLPLCRDQRCQTIGYIGDGQVLRPVLEQGVRGIDRIVPIGHTMDFDLIWDGYALPALLTRTVVIV